jgi:chromate transport protein ChrA
MAAGVYTIGRSTITDISTVILALASVIILSRRWLPAAVVVLAAGVVSWYLGP